MKRIQSNNISVFPSTGRTQYPSSKLTSEYNFVNIINSIVDRDSYVLSYDAGNNELKFVIHGYYFVVNGLNPFTSQEGAYIKVEAGNDQRLVSQKSGSGAEVFDDGDYYGLNICDSGDVPSNDNNYTYYFLKFLRTAPDGTKKLNSLKINSDSVGLSGTDATSVTESLASKQGVLSVGQGAGDFGLAINGNVISLNEKTQALLASANGNKGSDTQPIYIKNSQFAASNGNAGKAWDGSKETYAVMKNGVLSNGATIYVGSTQPAGGQNGDIWFKI